MQIQHTIPLRSIAENDHDKLAIKPFLQEDISAHDHDCFELAYVTGGTAQQTLDQVTTTISNGRLFYHRLRQPSQLSELQILYPD